MRFPPITTLSRWDPPQVSMYDFFLRSSHPRRSVLAEVQDMPIRKLRRKLRQAMLPANGSRRALLERHKACIKETLAAEGVSSPSEDESEEEEEDKTHPALILVDDATGNKYMRTVQCAMAWVSKRKWLG